VQLAAPAGADPGPGDGVITGWMKRKGGPLLLVLVVLGVVYAVAVVGFRFLSGRPMDGQPRTDATFFTRATVSVRPHVTRPSRWSMLAGWQRAVVRVVVLVAVAVWCRWWLADAAGAVLAARAGGVGVAVAVVVYVAYRGRRWRLDVEVVEPLAAALRPVLGHPASLPARRFLRIPRVLVSLPPSRMQRAVGDVVDRYVEWRDAELENRPGWVWVLGLGSGRWRDAWVERRPGSRLMRWWLRVVSVRAAVAIRRAGRRERRRASARVVVKIPHTMGAVPEDARAALLAHSAVKLGGEWVPEWHLRGSSPQLRLRHREYPPRRVDFAAMAPRMLLTGSTELALGLTIGSRTVTIDVETDSPHVLLSMGTGAGKSVLLRLLAAQALRKGWAVILLDYKQDHYWAQNLIDEGMTGLFYFRKIEDIHNTLIRLEGIRQYRSDVDFDARGGQEMQRVLVLFEEMNVSVNMLRAYWQSVRVKGQPAKSPALTAFGALAGAGRSARMHLVAVGQYLTAQVFGGPEARENFGARVLGRYSAASWRTLVPEFGAPPARSLVRGRVQVCQGETRAETQVAFLTHDEVAAWARGGLAGVVPAGELPFSWELPSGPLAAVEGDVPGNGEVPSPRSGLRLVQGGGTSGDDPTGGELLADDVRLPLSEWVGLGTLPGTYEAVRKRAQRDRARFPRSPDDRYSLGQVRAWHESWDRPGGDPADPPVEGSAGAADG
jgi:hypothetical protein